MIDRKYSLTEIDRMRAALQTRYGYNGPWCGWSSNGDEAEINKRRQAPYDIDVEDKLRTYLMAGIDPADLESALLQAEEIPTA